MLVAVFSDIHANLQAFEAVLDDARAAGVQERWCLGDVVGYGGDPDACVTLAAEHCDVLLAGNHDLAATGDLSVEDFSLRARLSAEWTGSVLSDASRRTLAPLTSQAERAAVGLYHGSPRHPVWEYVITAALADLCLDSAAQRVCIVGHSHVAGAYGRRDGQPATGASRGDGDVIDAGHGEWLVNPGSVGQPRDGDPRAAWLALDTESFQFVWHRSAYDIPGAQAAILAAGLPGSLAERLQYGQ
ncbi:MAG: metallophosphoesterase family protein [Solirubrobacterales bacterium]|nr:metallophosphoesterase family protein [Solirubrobacterales bacterium]